jgi:hypothetical protein
MAVTEGVGREGILKQKQKLLQLCLLHIQIPPPGRGLGDFAIADDRYRRVVEQSGTVGNEIWEREREIGKERI